MATLLKSVVLLALLGSVLFAADPVLEDNRLVVHEWGTFTSISGSDGISLDWRPLSGPSDLPTFVYGTKGLRECAGDPRQPVKVNLRARVRMETPVLYFYAPRETTVSVQVDFPKGRITEWYPQAFLSRAGIDWGRVTVLPGARVDFPVEPQASHYYPARETDANPIRVSGHGGPQHEKFLFYRGLGTFDLPLLVRLDGDKLIMKTYPEIGQVVVFESRGGEAGYGIHEVRSGEAAVERPKLGRAAEALYGDLERLLVSHGLYEKEARAMVKTWRDSWFEEGLRVFYILPQRVTDAVLPLTIEPRPVELVRVLVGRTEVLTPEMELDILRSFTLETALPHGRFAEPVLRRAAETATDGAMRQRVAAFLRAAETCSVGR